jgi:glycerol-3-phosphate dehydrogenase (NAD(P)+)
LPDVTRATVFGAGAAGTAVAMHLARSGTDTILWASPFDSAVLPVLLEERRHPNLPEFLPAELTVLGPERLEAAGDGIDIAVMGAHSAGARTLARTVRDGCGELPLVVGLAKGLEPDTRQRMSEVYGAEARHGRVVSVGGPALAPELAEGFHTGMVFAALDVDTAEQAASAFRSATLHVAVTDDIIGLEYCTVAKNPAAIGLGILDGMGRVQGHEYRNAKAALFTLAFHELARLVEALGGRRQTAMGLAGLGDLLVTSLGGRNRLYGELLGEGVEPLAALRQLQGRGMTVEGVESTREVHAIAGDGGVPIPFFTLMYRILFEGAPAASVLDCLEEGSYD